MKEELIKFETAKLAKEKGFNIQCYSNCWIAMLDGRIIHNSKRTDKAEDERYTVLCMQPTQSLLQKWLREKHSIDIYIVSYTNRDDDTKKEYEPHIVTDKISREMNDEIVFPSYEEALEVALVEALKEIK